MTESLLVGTGESIWTSKMTYITFKQKNNGKTASGLWDFRNYQVINLNWPSSGWFYEDDFMTAQWCSLVFMWRGWEGRSLIFMVYKDIKEVLNSPGSLIRPPHKNIWVLYICQNDRGLKIWDVCSVFYLICHDAEERQKAFYCLFIVYIMVYDY